MSSNGFHWSPESLSCEPCPAIGSGEGKGTLDGSLGVNNPSSRSLSYTMTVPSAWDAKNTVLEDGTHRTAVQGEDEMQPFIGLRKVATEIEEYSLLCLCADNETIWDLS